MVEKVMIPYQKQTPEGQARQEFGQGFLQWDNLSPVEDLSPQEEPGKAVHGLLALWEDPEDPGVVKFLHQVDQAIADKEPGEAIGILRVQLNPVLRTLPIFRGEKLASARVALTQREAHLRMDEIFSLNGDKEEKLLQAATVAMGADLYLGARTPEMGEIVIRCLEELGEEKMVDYLRGENPKFEFTVNSFRNNGNGRG